MKEIEVDPNLAEEQAPHRFKEILLRLVMWGIPVTAIVAGLSFAIASLGGGMENPESRSGSEGTLPPPRVEWFNPSTGFKSETRLYPDSFISGVEIPLPPLNKRK